jgi:nucleotide-binding universal stress UspA family protein
MHDMIKSLLVPLDGSPTAEGVLPHVIALAQAFEAQVMLLRVSEPFQLGDPNGSVDPLRWQMVCHEARGYLNAIGARLHALGIPQESVHLEGNAAERLIEYARQNRHDLTVLNSHGHSGLRQWSVSSVVQKVLMQPCGSSLLVRAHQPAAAEGGSLRYRRVLVPLDGSLRSEHALTLAPAVAQRFGAELLAAHAIARPEMVRRTPPTPEDLELSDRVVRRNLEEAEAYFEQLRSRMPLEIHTRLLEGDNIRSQLHDIVGQESIDLVVLCAHGSASTSRWPYGSVTSSFIFYGTTPLLIVWDMPAAAPADQAAADQPVPRSSEVPQNA